MNAERAAGIPPLPEVLYEELFVDVQTRQLLADSKTFVDALPRAEPAVIVARYRRDAQREAFDLARFVAEHFELPEAAAAAEPCDPGVPVRAHIERLWDALTRTDDEQAPFSTRIALPQPYVVPGGRFREIYYWDSYFTMLGLAAAGRDVQIEQMLENFAYLIDVVGFVPNGNRSYFCSRSQPPFFALMVELLADLRHDDGILKRFLPQLEREYAFWMRGRRAVAVDGLIVNRYWDDVASPRPESYAEDLATQQAAGREPEALFRDIRAACESGWDFSSRWLADGESIASIRTTGIVPVDLNCLLHELERVLARASDLAGDTAAAERYAGLQAARADFVRQRCFDPDRGLFTDLLLPTLTPAPAESLAAMFPLYCGIAGPEQAQLTAGRLRRDFLKAGGWQTSLRLSGQQWDAPSGWAPLQWICYQGLLRYGFDDDARDGAARWVENNLGVYRASGRLMERYDVAEPGTTARGGEYKVQDGFGWTNGVLLRLMDELQIEQA